MIVVDTNVWSELLRAEPDDRVLQWEAANSHLLWLSVIVVAELRARTAFMPAGRRRKQIRDLIEQVVSQYSDRVLIFDERCSREYGPVVRAAHAAGTPIDAADALIAATARAHRMKVATRNLDDFAGADVEIIDPWQA